MKDTLIEWLKFYGLEMFESANPSEDGESMTFAWAETKDHASFSLVMTNDMMRDQDALEDFALRVRYNGLQAHMARSFAISGLHPPYAFEWKNENELTAFWRKSSTPDHGQTKGVCDGNWFDAARILTRLMKL